MTDLVSIERDGVEAARTALESCVESGGVAIFPADTLYGLACDPLDAGAIERIHDLKGREADKPSAVMYFSALAMREVIVELGPRAREAIATLLPGPVTVIVDNSAGRYPLAGAADPGSLGLRLINGPLAGVRMPVFQTSANLSGGEAPHRFADVRGDLVAAADLAIDAGELLGDPSTVVDLTAIDESGQWRILREGAMPAAEVARRLAGANTR